MHTIPSFSLPFLTYSRNAEPGDEAKQVVSQADYLFLLSGFSSSSPRFFSFQAHLKECSINDWPTTSLPLTAGGSPVTASSPQRDYPSLLLLPDLRQARSVSQKLTKQKAPTMDFSFPPCRLFFLLHSLLPLLVVGLW